MFKRIYERMGQSVNLVTEKSTGVEKVRQNSGLQINLFDWLETCGGTWASFIDPGFIYLVHVYSI